MFIVLSLSQARRGQYSCKKSYYLKFFNDLYNFFMYVTSVTCVLLYTLKRNVKSVPFKPGQYKRAFVLDSFVSVCGDW